MRVVDDFQFLVGIFFQIAERRAEKKYVSTSFSIPVLFVPRVALLYKRVFLVLDFIQFLCNSFNIDHKTFNTRY